MSRRILLALFSVTAFSAFVFAQDTIPNWPAPELWSHPGRTLAAEKQAGVGTEAVEAVEAVPTAPLHFVGITPCRVADTRGNGFAGQYGPPALTPAGRNMVITGQCGIPGDAQAVSFNFSAVNVAAAGFFVAYPAGGAFPPVATMTYNQNTPNLSNAAVVPLGTGGAITVVAAVTNIDLVVDVNGYYRAGVVTAVNGLTGNVTLAAGSNLTITPSGQMLTIASTGALPAGTSGQTLRHDGSNWIANSILTNDGTDVTVTGALTVTGNMSNVFLKRPSSTLFHICCATNSTYLGISAGNLTNTAGNNVGVGTFALGAVTSGGSNIAIGQNSLAGTTTGAFNTAVGSSTMSSNIGGGSNTAIGYFALAFNETGSNNIALGQSAGYTNTGGSGNIFIGNSSGTANTVGNNNIYIGNVGFNNESGQIRIGTLANITSGAVIVGISGFGSANGIPVIVNGGGRLGTTTSSARFKEDVRNINSESDGLMKLRPVAFRYKESHEPGRLQQYGLIAEEVAQVYPELVVNDDEGRPLAIRSQLLDPLLLNELQKQRRTIDEQRAELDAVKAKLEKLETLLEKRMD